MDVETNTAGNWIPDINRFNLPVPPAWFLQMMWDQDSGLILLPSRQTRKYLLARRRSASLSMAKIAVGSTAILAKLDANYSDSDLLLDQYLVSVDTITGSVYHGTWSPALLAELKARDMWAAGGADKYVTAIEDKEQVDEARKRAVLVDNIDHRARDAWRSYQARTGQRSRLADARTPPRAKILQVGTL